MSDPVVYGESWAWEEISDELDLGNRTDDDGGETQQYRHHLSVSATRLITAVEAGSWVTRIGEIGVKFSANIGDTVVTKAIDSGKFICVRHKLIPRERPARFADEHISWEMYTKWADVPAEWEWDI